MRRSQDFPPQCCLLAAHDIPKSPKSCSSYSHNHPGTLTCLTWSTGGEDSLTKYKFKIPSIITKYRIQERPASIFLTLTKKGFRMMTRFFIFDTAADKAFHIPPLIKECWPTYHPFTNQPAFQVLYKYRCRHQQCQH